MPITGNAQIELPKIAAKLAMVGDVGLRTEVSKALKKALPPVIERIQFEAGMDFPKAGGMNRIMQRRKPKQIVKTSGRNFWIRLQYSGTGFMGDYGPWLHPVFGRNRTPKPNESWRETSFPRSVGYWERGGNAARPQAEMIMQMVLPAIVAQINGRL